MEIPGENGVFIELHVLRGDSKWGRRLQITSLLKGRKTQTNKQTKKGKNYTNIPFSKDYQCDVHISSSEKFNIWFETISLFEHLV